MIDILPDLIECGVDVYNPVQVSANNMNPAVLKERFGNRLVFYGGAFDAVNLPTNTDPAVVYEQNGIYNYDRTTKFDMRRIAKMFGKTTKRRIVKL